MTAQGAYPKQYLEENADTIYENAPEYSYTLNPSALSQIRINALN